MKEDEQFDFLWHFYLSGVTKISVIVLRLCITVYHDILLYVKIRMVKYYKHCESMLNLLMFLRPLLHIGCPNVYKDKKNHQSLPASVMIPSVKYTFVFTGPLPTVCCHYMKICYL